jgi:sugar phosphate isomerase/epimerase
MSMKLGFIGGKKPEQTEEMAKLARACGYQGLEFDYWSDFEKLTDDAVKAQQKTLKNHRVGVSAYGLWGYNHISLNADERAHALKMLDRAIGYAEQLGARAFVTGGGDLRNEPLGRKVAIFLEVFTPILKRIQSAGMQAAFYAVHGNSFFGNIESYERVWEHLPDVKMKFDPANWLGAGHDYLAIMQRYGNKIGHFHVKELIRIDGRLVSQPPAGMGEMPWGRILTFLYEHNYDGYLSVEPHRDPWLRGEGLKKNLVLSKRHLEQFLL